MVDDRTLIKHPEPLERERGQNGTSMRIQNDEEYKTTSEFEDAP